MGELLMEESGAEPVGMAWSVEKRFRVTEVFLAVLWVWISLLSSRETEDERGRAFGYMLIRGSAVQVRTYHGYLLIASCLVGELLGFLSVPGSIGLYC